jgi:hypothetical protein
VKVFWFFFAKKNKKEALLFEKRSKNFLGDSGLAGSLRAP